MSHTDQTTADGRKGDSSSNPYLCTTSGYEIEWVTPWSPSCNTSYLLERKDFRIGLTVDTERHPNPDEFIVYLWTNAYHKDNSEGEWHAVAAAYQGAMQVKDNEKVCLMYGLDLMLTGLGQFKFCFKAKHKFEQAFKWAEEFEVDGQITVRLPVKYVTTWIQEPMSQKITHNVYIGNFTAAMQCTEEGFDCLLNMADDVHVFPNQFARPLVYKKCILPFGVANQIRPEVVAKCVKWLRSMSGACNKVLVCSRMGNARAGSILIAYIYFLNPDLTFEEAYSFVDRRSLVFPHRGLKDTVISLYPRS